MGQVVVLPVVAAVVESVVRETVVAAVVAVGLVIEVLQAKAFSIIVIIIIIGHLKIIFESISFPSRPTSKKQHVFNKIQQSGNRRMFLYYEILYWVFYSVVTLDLLTRGCL